MQTHARVSVYVVFAPKFASRSHTISKLLVNTCPTWCVYHDSEVRAICNLIIYVCEFNKKNYYLDNMSYSIAVLTRLINITFFFCRSINLKNALITRGINKNFCLYRVPLKLCKKSILYAHLARCR